MTDYGVTNSGFQIKRLQDAKAEIETSLRTALGSGINLLPSGFLGQLVGIIAERDALNWQAMQGAYNAFSPTSGGVSLDNFCAFTGIKRLSATKGTGSGVAYGTLGTVIPAGSIVSVNGNSSAKFITTIAKVIAAGTDEIQKITFSAVPDAGAWALVLDGQQTGVLAFNDNAAAVQVALNALLNLSAVTVAGNYAAGFTITFAGADGQKNQSMIQAAANSLTNGGNQVNLSFAELTPGVLPNVTIPLEAQAAGVVPAYANSLTVIETPVAGWDTFNNPLDITPGKDIETDAEFRLRRLQTLSTAGAATLDAIRSRVLGIDEVSACQAYHNITMVVDGEGRPPKSIQVVVVDGDDQEIADTIWDVAPAGIELFGTTTKNVTDSQGFLHPVKFSRPTQVPIYMVLTLTKDSSFPIGGDAAVKAAVVAYGEENFGIGADVITTRFFCPINTVQGITDITIDIGVAPAPVGDANIVIGDIQIAQFDTAFISVVTV